MSIDLALATTEDMVAELKRRGVTAALVVSPARGRAVRPVPNLPPYECERVYADSFLSLHPAGMAMFLCQGVDWCLTDALGDRGGPLAVELSKKVLAVQFGLEGLVAR